MQKNNIATTYPVRSIIAAFAAAPVPAALAGEVVGVGSITFSPASVAAVPTLGNVFLVLLAGLLGLIALKSYHRTRGVTPLIAGMLTVAALATAGGGFNLLRQAQAGVDTKQITQSNGQSFTLLEGPNRFLNNAGTALSPTEIEVVESCTIVTDEGPEPDCEIGQVLENGSNCQLRVTCELIEVSDRRLKTDISLTRVADNGLPVYRFRYRNGTQYYEGVMAQDVLDYMEEAVVRNADGYYAVNYGMLGMSMRRVD